MWDIQRKILGNWPPCTHWIVQFIVACCPQHVLPSICSSSDHHLWSHRIASMMSFVLAKMRIKTFDLLFFSCIAVVVVVTRSCLALLSTPSALCEEGLLWCHHKQAIIHNVAEAYYRDLTDRHLFDPRRAATARGGGIWVRSRTFPFLRNVNFCMKSNNKRESNNGKGKSVTSNCSVDSSMMASSCRRHTLFFSLLCSSKWTQGESCRAWKTWSMFAKC